MGLYGFLLDFLEFSPSHPDISSQEAVVLYWNYHDLSISFQPGKGMNHFTSAAVLECRSPDDWQQDWWHLY